MHSKSMQMRLQLDHRPAVAAQGIPAFVDANGTSDNGHGEHRVRAARSCRCALLQRALRVPSKLRDHVVARSG